jgi:lipopolysaccharide cholinephosphotransferase
MQELNKAEQVRIQLESDGVGLQQLSENGLRRVQLEILHKIGDFCAVQNIRYYMFAGTLLGAVRHRGYIPWDDDIDIMMPRIDYERFCREFVVDSLTDHFSLYSSETCPNFLYPYVKVGSDLTLLVEDFDTAVPLGVNVDVFPLDGWPDGRIAVRIHRWRMRLDGRLLAAKASRRRLKRSWPKLLLLAALRPIMQRVSVTSIVDRITRRATSFPFNTSNYVGVTVWAYRERVPRKSYGSPVELRFEDRTWPAPCNYELVLHTIYGDYMRLPPEDDRQSQHAFVAYQLR